MEKAELQKKQIIAKLCKDLKKATQVPSGTIASLILTEIARYFLFENMVDGKFTVYFKYPKCDVTYEYWVGKRKFNPKNYRYIATFLEELTNETKPPKTIYLEKGLNDVFNKEQEGIDFYVATMISTLVIQTLEDYKYNPNTVLQYVNISGWTLTIGEKIRNYAESLYKSFIEDWLKQNNISFKNKEDYDSFLKELFNSNAFKTVSVDSLMEKIGWMKTSEVIQIFKEDAKMLQKQKVSVAA